MGNCVEECIKHLKSFDDCSIHILTDDNEKLMILEKSAVNLDITVFDIDGSIENSKESLLDYMAKIMRFPDYFGMNWDAFDECVNDLSWWDTQGFMLIFRKADSFINHSIDDFNVFIEIIFDASKSWFMCGKPFHVIIISREWKSIPILQKIKDKVCFHQG